MRKTILISGIIIILLILWYWVITSNEEVEKEDIRNDNKEKVNIEIENKEIDTTKIENNLEEKIEITLTQLAETITGEDINLLKQYIKDGVDINMTTEQWGTALMGAIYVWNIKIINILLENGADIDAATIDGRTALTIAEENGNEDIIEMLWNFER